MKSAMCIFYQIITNFQFYQIFQIIRGSKSKIFFVTNKFPGKKTTTTFPSPLLSILHPPTMHLFPSSLSSILCLLLLLLITSTHPLLFAQTTTTSTSRQKIIIISNIQVNLKNPSTVDVSFISNHIHQYTFSDLKLTSSVQNEISTTYSKYSKSDENWAVITLKPNNKITGIFVPRPGIEFSFDASVNDPNAIIVIENDLDKHGGCTIEKIPELEQQQQQPSFIQKGQRAIRDLAITTNSHHHHHHRDLQLQSWIGSCFPQDATPRRMEIGIVVDTAFITRATLEKTTVNKLIETVIASASAVYLSQMNIELHVAQVILPDNPYAPTISQAKRITNCITMPSNDPTVSLPEMSCCSDKLYLSDRLQSLASWAKDLPLKSNDINRPIRQAHWAAFTDCHPAPGFVGRTYIGTLCGSQYNVGVTSWGNTLSTATWRIFTHEIGHAFNAQHAFELGVGNTGGIMDYGSGLYNNVYQFDPKRKPEICPHVTSQVDTCIYFSPSQSVCGDLVVDVEKGEECECPVRGQIKCNKCNNCRLDVGADCSPVSLSTANGCCKNDGTFAPSTTTCVKGMEKGICIRGTCQVNICPIEYDAGVCGAVQNDGCSVKCGVSTTNAASNSNNNNGQQQQNTMICSAMSFNVPDGIGCISSSSSSGAGAGSSNGICQDGKCVVANTNANNKERGKPTNNDNMISTEGNDDGITCQDLFSPWWDADEAMYTCNWYANNIGMCDRYGHEYRNFGFAASQVCCACGGGIICPKIGDAEKCFGKKQDLCGGLNNDGCIWCENNGICMAGNNVLGCANPNKFYGRCKYPVVLSTGGDDTSNSGNNNVSPTTTSGSSGLNNLDDNSPTITPSTTGSPNKNGKCSKRKTAKRCNLTKGCLWCVNTCILGSVCDGEGI
jgi:hypothetical protein